MLNASPLHACRVLLLLLAAIPGVLNAATPAAPPPPVTSDVRVSVTVMANQKKVPAAGAVVWIPGSKLPAPPPGSARISSKSKRFDPRIVAVPVGATVDFPNLDRIFHNVFSLSEKAKFDLGLYKKGTSKPVTFQNPGLVRIYCNIHPQMAAYLMVVDGDIFGVSGTDGVVTLSGIPVGKHPVKVWDEKGGETMTTVEVIAGRTAPLAVVMDGSSWREVPHLNKYGKEYAPPDDDENRY
ncbi:MAG: hypothetical protein ABIT01_05105 [Thermoanaerobaculia bacterium]